MKTARVTIRKVLALPGFTADSWESWVDCVEEGHFRGAVAMNYGFLTEAKAVRWGNLKASIAGLEVSETYFAN